MRVTVKKWSNSAALRIPATVMQAARLRVDAPVDICEEDGRVVITPVRERRFDLGELLDGITEDNLHGEADFGAPMGNEAL